QQLTHLGAIGPFDIFGLTTILGVGIVGFVAIVGFTRHTRHQRLTMRRTLLGVGAFMVVGLAGLVGATLFAEDDLRTGNRAARSGLDAFRNGELFAAADLFDVAARSLSNAERALAMPWAQPSRLVPVAAQHRTAMADLSDAGADAASRIAAVLRIADYDALSPSGGRIDLDAVRALQAPLRALEAALGRLDRGLTAADSDWLFPSIGDRLARLRRDVSRQYTAAGNATAAVEQAPAMLGADGPRRYFIAFTTPAEARGSGGFMGNFAELTADAGRLSLSDFGRTLELNAAGGRRTLTPPDDTYLANYGSFIYADQRTLTIGPQAWSNITTSPHFPSVARTIDELYPTSGGGPIDGVFMLDVLTVSRLMELTGPVDLDDGTTIAADGAVRYLLAEQYRTTDTAERVDALETIARTTVERLLDLDLPGPARLGELLGPMARQGRLAAWAERSDEQDVFRRLGTAGELPTVVNIGEGSFAPGSFGDGLSVTLTNATGNKLDHYLDGAVDYEVDIDRDNGIVDGTITLTLTSTAPTTGWPDGVIGNDLGLPPGTNRTYVTIYTALQVVSMRIDGTDTPFTPGSEQGWQRASTPIDLAAGDSVRIVLTVQGFIAPDDDYRVTVRSQPTVRPFPFDVIVDRRQLRGSPVIEAGYTQLSIR
ncbi:MAG: DUF4012 domain-containing protein, partial [Ilumatobacteraceae bacterium]